jgi:hypothetical protein
MVMFVYYYIDWVRGLDPKVANYIYLHLVLFQHYRRVLKYSRL